MNIKLQNNRTTFINRLKLIVVLFCILFSVNLSSAQTFNRYYDSGRVYLRFFNSYLTNPAFTGFNSHFAFAGSLGFYTPDIPITDGTHQPKDIQYSSEFSVGKPISFSLGFSRMYKNESVFYTKDFLVAASVSLQTSNLGNFRIGASMISETYSYELIYGFAPQDGKSYYKVGGIKRYNAGIFYSFKNYIYAGFSILDINEEVFSFYQNEESKYHSIKVFSLGGSIHAGQKTDLNANTQIQSNPAYKTNIIESTLGIAYLNKYFFNAGTKFIHSTLNSYFILINADLFRCTNISFRYEILAENHFSKALSPWYWSIGAGLYLDRFLIYR